jgi:microcystin-dependent protein
MKEPQSPGTVGTPPARNSTALNTGFFTDTVGPNGTSTIVDSDWCNDVTQELINVMSAANVPQSNNQNDVLTSIQILIQQAQANANIIGEIRAYTGTTAPSGWAMAFGQQVPRASFPSLFSVIGTTYGAGNGTTTFNLPDCRGRFLAGLDNMGGTAAGVITQAVSGVNSEAIGAVGGSQATQAHTHPVNDPSHVHGVNDPSHNHPLGDPGHAHGYPAGFSEDANPPGAGDAATTDEGDQTNTTDVSGTGIFIDAAFTGISIQAAVTGITNQTFGAGNSQNIPPVMMINYIIFTGQEVS